MSQKKIGALLSFAEQESQNGSVSSLFSTPVVLSQHRSGTALVLQHDVGNTDTCHACYVLRERQLFRNRMNSDRAYDAWLNHVMLWGHL